MYLCLSYPECLWSMKLWPRFSVCFGLGFYGRIKYEEQKQVPSFVSTICLMDLSKMEIRDDHFTFDVMHLADQIPICFFFSAFNVF